MKIVVLDGYAGNPGDLSWAPLEALGECTVYDRTAPDEVTARAAGAQIVLTNKVVMDRATIEALPSLRYIGVMATGYNIVDLDAARHHGVVVTNVPAYSTTSVAQMVFAHLLDITNSVQHYTREAHQGQWCKSRDFTYLNTPVIELCGKTMGIVGMGSIGAAVAKIALALGMNVLAHTSKPQEALPEGITKADLDTVFSTSDVISLHCPLTADTRGMVNAQRLAQMKRGAILINTARGPLVDEAALAEALASGHLLGAGLDVLSVETQLPSNPLLSQPTCHITPHLGWASTEARQRLMNTLVANVAAYLKGTPQNVVNA
ncbi:MAG: D-2-hydroxyacid dehydrogenase [Bacteroidales bacterium]|nr:D-2-hydroxyacid dehydrogenase [Bacteroidales bacterium]